MNKTIENTIKISVIIPLYNRIDYIKETIDSVFSQGVDNIELLVVDDGSTDGSYEFVEELMISQPIISLLAHPNRANKGQSAALNIGLKESKGEYIAILDSDDMFADNKLKNQLAYLELHDNVGMVYGNGEAITADGEFLYKTLSKRHSENGNPNNLLLDCYIAIPGGSLVRKTVFEEAGFFNETFRAAQDHDMALRLFEITKVAYLAEIAFKYRKHDQAISKNGLERRWRAGLEILKQARSRYPYNFNTIRKRYAVLNFHLAQVLLQNKKNRIEAIARLFLSGICDPKRAIKIIFRIEKAS
jgi:glycosyltransferase involved in cell wall biosynthesis